MQLPRSAVNAPPLAFAAERRAVAPLLVGTQRLPLSIDISRPYGAQQQTHRMPRLRWYDGTDRQTDARSFHNGIIAYGGSVAEWLACWTQAQKGSGSNRSRYAVG